MELDFSGVGSRRACRPSAIAIATAFELPRITFYAPAQSGSMYRRIARNSALLAGGTVASSALAMLAVAIATRALPAREFGVLVLLQSSVLMLRALVSFSTQQPVIKLGSDAQAREEKQRLGDIVSMGLLVDMAASLLALAIAALFIEVSRGTIGLADANAASAWIVAASLLFSAYPTSNGVFRLYNRFDLLSLSQIASAVGLVVAYVLLFLIHAGLQAYVAAWAIYSAASGLFQLWLAFDLLRRDGVPLRPAIRPFATRDGRTLLDYCWTTWGTSTADAIRSNGDSLLVGAIVSVEAAGVYSAARQIAGILRKCTGIYSSTVFPEIARLSASRDAQGAHQLNRRMLRAGVAIGVAAVFLAAIFGLLTIKLLFGPGFTAAFPALVVLTAAAAAQLISFTPMMCVQVYCGPKALLVLQGVATVGFAIAAIVLTFAFSMTGMALAQLLFAVALTLMCNMSLRRATAASRSQPEEADNEDASPLMEAA